jgi:hypothetical protein
LEAAHIEDLLSSASAKDTFLESVRAEREREHRRKQVVRDLSIEDTLINVERQKKREAFLREQTCAFAIAIVLACETGRVTTVRPPGLHALHRFIKIKSADERNEQIKKKKDALRAERMANAKVLLHAKHELTRSMEQLRVTKKWDKLQDFMYVPFLRR